MKIECWKDLDKVYLSKRGKKLTIYIKRRIRTLYENNCKYCKKYLLTTDKTFFCNHTCSSKYHNPIRKYCRENSKDLTEYLYDLHWKQDLPLKQIAEKHNCMRSTVTRLFKENNIIYRNNSQDNSRRYKYMSNEEIKKQTKSANKKMREMIEKGIWILCQTDEKHPSYIDGRCSRAKNRSYPNIFKQKRLEILERDEHHCQNPFCRNKSNNLIVHHIDHNKWNCEDNNLITLCNSCNKLADNPKKLKCYEDYYKKANKIEV